MRAAVLTALLIGAGYALHIGPAIHAAVTHGTRVLARRLGSLVAGL